MKTIKKRSTSIMAAIFLLASLWGCGSSSSHNVSQGNTATPTESATPTNSTLAAVDKFVLVDGGTFTMGDDTVAKSAPAHPVTLSGFYISKYELTFDEYDAFTAATGRTPVSDSSGTGGGSKPVYGVSWYDVIEYCNWRSTKEALTPVYTIDKTNQDPNNTSTTDTLKWTVTANWAANGYRLPTEAEWEFAAKGGTKSQGFIYSGSNDPNEVAWYGGKAGNGTVTKKGDLRAVGSLKANELGIYDMSGNVAEWVWDRYDTNRAGYAGSQSGQIETNPTGITGAYNKFVFRGGSSGGPPACMLVTKRFTKDPTFVMCPAGIRLVRSKS